MYATVLILQIFAEIHVPERGNIDVAVQTNDDVEILEHQETDVDKKRKRAREDDVHNDLSLNANILS